MADDSFNDGRASEEPYTRIRTLGRGAFGEAVLYRKTEVSYLFEPDGSCSRNRKLCIQCWAPRRHKLRLLLILSLCLQHFAVHVNHVSIAISLNLFLSKRLLLKLSLTYGNGV